VDCVVVGSNANFRLLGLLEVVKTGFNRSEGLVEHAALDRRNARIKHEDIAGLNRLRSLEGGRGLEFISAILLLSFIFLVQPHTHRVKLAVIVTRHII